MLPARAVSFPADQVFPRGWRAWRSILSPVHVPAHPTGALGCPCCLCLSLSPPSLSWGVTAVPWISPLVPDSHTWGPQWNS